MLIEKELKEIRKLLEESNNPVYLFDDDGDGVCSYLVLKKHYKKGTGIAIKKAGPLDTFYIQHIEEEKADLVVVLDKAVAKQEFIDSCPCPVLYIDHHPLQNLKKAKYYNPLKHNKKIYLPTSYMAYQITNSNLWIATIGCLFDYYIPDFIKEFKKTYPDLVTKIKKDPGYLKYEGQLGKLVKIFTFNMKGKGSEVKKALKALEKVDSPYEILNQTTEDGEYLYKRYEKLNREYSWLLEEAKKYVKMTKGKLGLFTYPSTQTSFTGDLATELAYLHPNKIIIVAREKIDEMILSLRSQKLNVEKIFKKATEGLDSHGGGHTHAVGGAIKLKDFDIFIERIKKIAK